VLPVNSRRAASAEEHHGERRDSDGHGEHGIGGDLAAGERGRLVRGPRQGQDLPRRAAYPPQACQLDDLPVHLPIVAQ
jgi:hypothetical protein